MLEYDAFDEELIEMILAEKTEDIHNLAFATLWLHFIGFGKKEQINSSFVFEIGLSYRVSYAVASHTIYLMQTIFFVIGRGRRRRRRRRHRSSSCCTTSDSVSSVLL